MAEIFFPQLAVGAVTQYPVRKTRFFRTIKNILPDGRLILLPDRSARRVEWELTYNNISAQDAEALQSHFRICSGPFRSFVFLDPTENLLPFSSNLNAPVWLQSNQIQIEDGIADPLGGGQGFRLTNRSQVAADLYQALEVPTYFAYCLSVYVRSSDTSSIELFLRSENDSRIRECTCNSSWTRVSAQARLSEQSYELSTGLTLAPGQQLEIFGPQLEPQVAASGYRTTGARSGIYRSAHLRLNELLLTAEGPDLYSTTIILESAE